MPKRILVTGAGGAAAIAFLQSFSEGEYQFFAGDMDPNAAGLYLVPRSRRVLLPAATSATYVPRLLDLCRQHSIDALVPTVDAELLPLARTAERFDRVGTHVAVTDPVTLELCLDKAKLMAACASTGAVPLWDLFDDGFFPELFPEPIIVKPRSGSGGRGVELLRSAAEIRAARRSAELIAQEYLPGEEYSVDVFARGDGKVIAAVPRVRMKVDSGVAVTARTIHDDALERTAIAVAEAVGITGVANVQLRRDRRGVPRLLEVNPRLPGTMPLTVAAGVHMPRMLLEAAFGRIHPEARLPFEEIAMVRTWQEHFLPSSEIGAVASERRTPEPAVETDQGAAAE